MIAGIAPATQQSRIPYGRHLDESGLVAVGFRLSAYPHSDRLTVRRDLRSFHDCNSDRRAAGHRHPPRSGQ